MWKLVIYQESKEFICTKIWEYLNSIATFCSYRLSFFFTKKGITLYIIDLTKHQQIQEIQF